MQMPSTYIEQVNNEPDSNDAVAVRKTSSPGNTGFLVVSNIRGPYIKAPNANTSRGQYRRPPFGERIATVYELCKFFVYESLQYYD